jgi:Tfp pilus assembly protein PilN
MRRSSKTALGIDISEGAISLALLKIDNGNIKLLKDVSGSVPQGAVINGNVGDSALLSKAIKELIGRKGMQAPRAAISLLANPTLMQIVEMPKQMPKNIRQFVQDELKQYITLSGENVISDFCGIGSGTQPGKNRIFIAATNGQKVIDIVDACNRAGVNVEAIEPPLLAYVRAIYTGRIAKKLDSNVLIAILKGGLLTLGVFRKHNLDLVRTKEVTIEPKDSDQLHLWLAEEINTVTRFYDIEVPEDSGKWDILVVADDAMLPGTNFEESLKASISSGDIEVKSPENLWRDTPIAVDDTTAHTEATAVAVGLAMRLLGKDESGLRVNLLPQETLDSRSLKKQALITANVLGAILLIMVLAVGGLTLMIKKMNEDIVREKLVHPLHDTRKLVDEQKQIEMKIKKLSNGPCQLVEMLSSHKDVDWVGLLNDVRDVSPETICITKLFTRGDFGMSLEGFALSYDAVHLFVKLLDQSQHIDSASVAEAEVSERQGGLIRYVINCSLVMKKGK